MEGKDFEAVTATILQLAALLVSVGNMAEAAAHSLEDFTAQTRHAVAGEIFEAEQACLRAIELDPLNTHLAGYMRGLQRARDIAEGVNDEC